MITQAYQVYTHIIFHLWTFPERSDVTRTNCTYLRLQFEGSEPECASWAVQPGLGFKLGTGDPAMRPFMHSASFSWHSVLLLLAVSRAVIETWQVNTLTVIDKLKINDLILLLSGMDGPLLRYMHVFRIMQNVQEKFVSGIFYMRIYAFNVLTHRKITSNLTCLTFFQCGN